MSDAVLPKRERIPGAGMHPEDRVEKVEGYLVTASGELLGALVLSLLHSVSPNAEATLAKHATPNTGAIVKHIGTGRWLHISTNPRPDYSYAQALESGAASVLGIHSSRLEFDMAVQTLKRQSGTFVPPDVVSWLVGQSLHLEGQPQERRDEVRLTAREREVLQLVLEGQTNQEIARSLTISPNTVRSHMHALSVKLEASNRARLVHRARALGFDTSIPGSHLQPVRDISA